jgi:hypothetical protein
MARSARFSLDTSTSTRPSRYGQTAGLKLRIHEDISEARARARQLASISRKTARASLRTAAPATLASAKKRGDLLAHVGYLGSIR